MTSPRLSPLPGVTAIVQNYFEERQKYRELIWDALRGNTPQLERIIMWNNRFYPGSYDADDIFLIESDRNTLLGRYAAALLADTEYIFVQDNDLVIGPDTISRLLAVAQKHPDKIVGSSGCILGLGDKPYSSARWVAEGPADVILGRCWLAHRKALVPGFTRILSEGIYPGRCDDIVFSMAAGGGIVVPCEIRNLDEESVGLSHAPEHFEQRDAMALFIRGAHRAEANQRLDDIMKTLHS